MADADKPNDPGQKNDLKARLGLKGRSAAAQAPGPMMPLGVEMPPPEPEPPKHDPRQDARRTDATIPPRDENDHTPQPAVLPGVERVRVEYINISDGDQRADSQKKQRWFLIGAVLVAAAVAFLLGRGMASSAAAGEIISAKREEIAEKKKFLDASKPLYERMSGLRDELEKVVLAIAKANDDKTDLLDPAIEKQIGDVIGSLGKFAADKVALDPVKAVGTSTMNGELGAKVVALAVQTREVLVKVQATLDEATAMAPLWVAPAPETSRRNLLIEPTELPYQGVKVPISKGTLIVQPGPPQPVQVKDATGTATVTEYHQMVVVEGQKEPVEVKSTQVAVSDLAPIFAANAKAFKRFSFQRLALTFASLHESLKALDMGKVALALDEANQKIGR